MRRKGQHSLEFVMLFIFVLLIFMLLLGVASHFVRDRNKEQLKYMLDSIAEKIHKEILVGRQSTTYYESEFDIPDSINGISVKVAVDLGSVLYVEDSEGDFMVAKDIPKIYDYSTYPALSFFTGPLDGCNTLIKDENGIFLKDGCE